MIPDDSLHSLETEIVQCHSCSRLDPTPPAMKPHFIYAKDLSNVKLMIVGRNPGLGDNTTTFDANTYRQNYLNCPFGKYFFDRLGQDIFDKTIITNLCKCCSPNNEPMLESEIQNCMPFLVRQIKIFNPTVLVLTSKETISAVLGAKGLETLGIEEHLQHNGHYVYCLYHPTYVLRGYHNYVAKEINELKLKEIKELLS